MRSAPEVYLEVLLQAPQVRFSAEEVARDCTDAAFRICMPEKGRKLALGEVTRKPRKCRQIEHALAGGGAGGACASYLSSTIQP